MATSLLVHADVIDIERLDVLQEPVIPNLDDLAEGMARDVSVIIDEDGLGGVVDDGREFLFVIFGRVSLEQVRTDAMMHRIRLIQQGDDALDVTLSCFPNHTVAVVCHLISYSGMKSGLNHMEMLQGMEDAVVID